MSEEEKELLLEMMKFFTFELHRGIKEYGGASNFKTEEACDVIFKILYQYDVNIIDIKTHKDLEKEIQRLNNIINELEKWIDEESKKTILSTGHLTCLMMCKNKLQELKGSDKDA